MCNRTLFSTVSCNNDATYNIVEYLNPELKYPCSAFRDMKRSLLHFNSYFSNILKWPEYFLIVVGTVTGRGIGTYF